MRWWGKVQRTTFLQKEQSRSFVAIVKCTDGSVCIIPAQEHWYPNMIIEFGGQIFRVDETGYWVNVQWSVVSAEALSA